MVIETERLIIRNWQASDVNHYLVLAHDVGYNCFSRPGRFLVHSPEEVQEKVRQRMHLFDERKLGKFPMFLRATDEFVGTCGMEPFDLEGQSEIELGYRLCLNFWGKGYAKEGAMAMLDYGFAELKLPRIIAFVLPQNRASIRILESARIPVSARFRPRRTDSPPLRICPGAMNRIGTEPHS